MLFVSGYSIGLTEDNVFTGRVDALLLNRENVKKNTFMSNDTIRSLSEIDHLLSFINKKLRMII